MHTCITLFWKQKLISGRYDEKRTSWWSSLDLRDLDGFPVWCLYASSYLQTLYLGKRLVWILVTVVKPEEGIPECFGLYVAYGTNVV